MLGAYNSVSEAIGNLSDKYEPGEYIIQECTGDETAYRKESSKNRRSYKEEGL